MHSLYYTFSGGNDIYKIFNITKSNYQSVVNMASSGRGSIASGAASVFYTQQHINFDDLSEQEYYPEFIQYFQDMGPSRPSIGNTSIPRMAARPSIASISNTLKRGKR